MCKRKRCWYLLFRMEDGRAIHLYEPLRKYEVLSRLSMGGGLVATRRDYLIKRLTEDFVMVLRHRLCGIKFHFFTHLLGNHPIMQETIT